MAFRADPRSLELFCLVAQAGSFARAAGQAHLDATGLGRRIKSLEEGLGTLLFSRSPSGLRLTRSGERLLQRAEEVNRSLDSIAHEIRGTPEDGYGTVRIAANPSSMLSILPEAFVALRKTHPSIDIELTEAATPRVVELCACGVVDVGVGISQSGTAGVYRVKLLDDHLVLIVPHGHPLAAAGPIPFEDTLTSPHVVTQVGGSLDAVLFREARRLRRSVRAAITVQSYDCTFRMVESGMGVAIVPAIALRGFPGDARFVHRKLLEPWAKRELCIFSRWRTPPDSAVAAFHRTLLAHSRRAPPG